MPDSSDTKSIVQRLHAAQPNELPAVEAVSSMPGFSVRFWGVRGSIPTPGSETVKYGGNTACVEVSVAGQRIIFDGGTGLRVLGKHLLYESSPVHAHIFFTHTHWDRIQGFPFFTPAFIPENRFDIYGAAAANGASIKQCLTGQMLRPNFSIPLQKMSSEMVFHNISAGSIIPLGDGVTVETIALNPHTSALGFRITYEGSSLVYATDSDSVNPEIDPNLLYLAQDTDLLIYGGTYSEVVHPNSHVDTNDTWKKGIDLVQKTQTKSAIWFHHSPLHDDDYLEHIEAEMSDRCPKIHFAKEGMVLQLAEFSKAT